MKTNLLLLTFLFLLSSCEKENMVTSVILNPDPFSEIELNSSFDIFLIEDSIFSLEITGYAENVANIHFVVEDSVLKIYNERKYSWTTPAKNKTEIYIRSNSLNKVTATEACRIHTLTPITSQEFGLILGNKTNEASLELNCNTFYYWNNNPCGGKLTLYGKSKKLKIWNCAIMSVDAKDLITEYAHIENNSRGDCQVTVLDKLEYSIGGTGNIYLYSSPKEIIQNNISSSGRLIKR
jgi:hypothetical protein